MEPAPQAPDAVVQEFKRRRDRQWLVPALGFPFVMVGGTGGVILGMHLAKAFALSGQWTVMACVAVPFVCFGVVAFRFSERNFRCPACGKVLQYSGAGGLRYFRPGATCPGCGCRLT